MARFARVRATTRWPPSGCCRSRASSSARWFGLKRATRASSELSFTLSAMLAGAERARRLVLGRALDLAHDPFEDGKLGVAASLQGRRRELRDGRLLEELEDGHVDPP